MTHIPDTLRFWVDIWYQSHLCGFSLFNVMIKLRVWSQGSPKITMNRFCQCFDVICLFFILNFSYWKSLSLLVFFLFNLPCFKFLYFHFRWNETMEKCRCVLLSWQNMFLLETLEYYDTFFNWVEVFGKVITPKYLNPSTNSQNKPLTIFRNPNILAVKAHTPYFFLYNFSHVILFFSSSSFFYFVFLILVKEWNVNLFQWNRRQPNFFPHVVT